MYHCLFSSAPAFPGAWPDPAGYGDLSQVHGAQAGNGPLAALWMVYAKADRRWAGVDVTVVSLEILTVTFGGVVAAWVCWDIARARPRANLSMIVLATAELYGGEWIFFCCCWMGWLVADILRRLDDLHARVADGKPQPRHEQLHVQVDLFGLL